METELELLISKYQKQWERNGMGSGISYSSLLSDLHKLKEVVATSDQEQYDQGFHDGANKTAIELSNVDIIKSLPNEEQVKAWVEGLPYYGSCAIEYNEGFEEGVAWIKEKLIT